MKDVFEGVKGFGFGAMRLPVSEGGKDADVDVDVLMQIVDLFWSGALPMWILPALTMGAKASEA